jgi:arylsulfatase A-like enzyme
MGGGRRKDIDKFLVDEVRGTIQQRYLEQSLLSLDEARSEEDYFSPRVFRAAAKWLEQNARFYENFYLHIDSFDPHEPWNPPREYRYMYDRDYQGREIILPQNIMENMTEAEANHIRAMYAGKVTMVDRWFGYFMDKLDHMGLHEDTAVVVVSDHGHPLGEHGMWRKVPVALRFNMLDAVMLVSLPDNYQSHGKRYSTMVHEYDISPTLLDLAGIKAPESMNGKSLKPLLTGATQTHREYAAGGYNDHTYIRTPNYYYYKSLKDPKNKYLFDQKADPRHMTNLVDVLPQMLAEMEAMVAKELGNWTLPKNVGTSGYLNPYKPNFTVRDDAWTSIFD